MLKPIAVKETMHINWAKPKLNRQKKHEIICLHIKNMK